jgi:hypothetical protein
MECAATIWVDSLVQAQHADGGWGYGALSSWTEPTALAVLALGVDAPGARRGVDWLRCVARDDGGCAPHPTVTESSWVTALALLAQHASGNRAAAVRARGWLLRQAGRETSLVERWRRWLHGEQSPELALEGWPWLPSTAGWAVPTALTLAALRLTTSLDDSEARRRVRAGRAFLLSRAAKTGGWNHGSIRVFDIEGAAYPETTGCALIGLRGVRAPAVGLAVARARVWLAEARSAESWAWLRLGLLAQGIDMEPRVPPIAPSNPAETALALIATRAATASSALWSNA